ncbi:hypothetical protein AVEN_246350-1 [Araneus ventricosus]|uniref:Uncharacterized protein n=1 Tax=Araneus ventricosus TaxID=182803 RepID=A0A4Y2JBZ1_ARAVE|nr:hypothetical protein AVEN_246350-1 [Araneus ventricosus]
MSKIVRLLQQSVFSTCSVSILMSLVITHFSKLVLRHIICNFCAQSLIPSAKNVAEEHSARRQPQEKKNNSRNRCKIIEKRDRGGKMTDLELTSNRSAPRICATLKNNGMIKEIDAIKAVTRISTYGVGDVERLFVI